MSETFLIKEVNFVYYNGKSKIKSEFEDHLCSLWESAMSAGYFWYNLDHVQQRCLGGTYNICGQLNEKRFANRREPQSATQVVMPFNSEKFNFNKIQSQEVLMQLKIEKENKMEPCDLIIINVSPIDYGHVLLVPDSKSGIPQVINEYGFEKATQLCLLSTDEHFCIGFNSLCALASVNHQHFHIIFVDYTLPITRSVVQSIGKGLYILKGYMVNGFALQLANRNIETFVRKVVFITHYFCENNIAHNLFMCRSTAFDGSELKMVTVFLFPKVAISENTNIPFNVACLELGGFLPIKEKEEYNAMTEARAIEILNQQTYQSDQFQILCNEILSHF